MAARVIGMRISYLFLIVFFSLQAMENQNFNHELRDRFAGLDKQGCGIAAKIAGGISLFCLYQWETSYFHDQCLTEPCTAYSFGTGAFMIASAYLYHVSTKLPDIYRLYVTHYQNQVDQIINRREALKSLFNDHSCKTIIKATRIPHREH